MDLPAGVRKPDGVVYELDVYLGLDLEDDAVAERASALARAHGLDLSDGDGIQPMTDISDQDLERWHSVGEDLADIVERESLDVGSTVSAVSGIHVGYPNARGQHEVQHAEDPLDQEADARLELMPYAPDSIEEFREFLDHHLRCQIRDCLVKMGVVPPEPFQVTGFGKFRDARRYDHFEMYPELHMQDGDHRPLVP